MNKILDYINRKRPNNSVKETFSMRGYLDIFEISDKGKKNVFSRKNLIVIEGKGYVIDFLASLGYGPTYQIKPFGAIILTKNTAAEIASDTFESSVFSIASDKISHEGVLHVGSWTTLQSRTEGSLVMQLDGTISNQYGNDPANNHINSVCVCAGTNDAAGGPGQGAYAATGNERLWSRVHVGDLVKTSSKSYTFSWVFEIF